MEESSNGSFSHFSLVSAEKSARVPSGFHGYTLPTSTASSHTPSSTTTFQESSTASHLKQLPIWNSQKLSEVPCGGPRYFPFRDLRSITYWGKNGGRFCSRDRKWSRSERWNLGTSSRLQTWLPLVSTAHIYSDVSASCWPSGRTLTWRTVGLGSIPINWTV